MSKTNPEASVKAMFPTPIDCGFDVKVYPLSLGHYALLEKINSYLVNGDHTPDSFEVINTYYICTHQAKDILNDFENLSGNAIEWSESLPPCITNNIAKAIRTQIDLMMNVIPVVGGGDKKKETVAETDS